MTNISLVQFMWLTTAICLVFILILRYKFNDSEKVVVRKKSPLPLTLEDKSENTLSFRTEILFVNEGTQCATIMDAFVRPQLPYEQYDGIEVRAKAEREGFPREDDYFEAVLIQKKDQKDDRLTMRIKVKLAARKGLSLEDALAGMPDLPLDLIYQETGRNVAHYNKLRLVIKAEDVARLAGIKLVSEPFIMR